MVSLVGTVASLTLHIYYTTNVAICQEVFEKFLKKFFGQVAHLLYPREA